MNEEKWEEGWINIGKFSNFVTGKRWLIFYANTQDMIWHLGVVINNFGLNPEEDLLPN